MTQTSLFVCFAGKGDIVLDNDIVLTKMKLLNNVPEKLLNVEDSISTVSISMSEQDNTEALQADEAISVHSTAPETTAPESKTDYLSAIFADSELPRLYKFESDDSGVEMTSGATSPSTPTGSEQSFVVHSRESSCDSSKLNSPVLADNPLEDSSVFLETEQTSCECAKQDTLTILGDRTEEENVDDDLIDVTADLERSEDRTLRNTMEDCKDAIEIMAAQEDIIDTAMTEDTMSRSQCSIEAYDGKTGPEFHQRPLRKSTTSDSLDEYMEECCRLSEVVNNLHVFYCHLLDIIILHMLLFKQQWSVLLKAFKCDKNKNIMLFFPHFCALHSIYWNGSILFLNKF